ncbi:unnamed protein product [Microthlaspi erraticum]|uniref:Uncharacterized protein n=1 Tax=Microthlaspi erraticum TaxID=1685480 RepID=A0A6D2IXJ8_9BRAS|nr:unnamed protein product [Microthlaspi erraticum]
MQNNRRIFFYPLSFSPRSHSSSSCRFSITLRSFRRDIYRPITGKERLFGQTPLDPPRHLRFDIPSEFIASDIVRCRRQVTRFLKDVEPRIRETLVLYAIQLYGESGGRAFKLKADAEDVELHLMEESKGWSTTCISKSIDPVSECIICLDESDPSYPPPFFTAGGEKHDHLNQLRQREVIGDGFWRKRQNEGKEEQDEGERNRTKKNV